MKISTKCEFVPGTLPPHNIWIHYTFLFQEFPFISALNFRTSKENNSNIALELKATNCVCDAFVGISTERLSGMDG